MAHPLTPGTCIHGVMLADPCESCEVSLDFEDGHPPGLDNVCYMGHSWCYDQHWAERRSDEAEWEEERNR